MLVHVLEPLPNQKQDQTPMRSVQPLYSNVPGQSHHPRSVPSNEIRRPFHWLGLGPAHASNCRPAGQPRNTTASKSFCRQASSQAEAPPHADIYPPNPFTRNLTEIPFKRKMVQQSGSMLLGGVRNTQQIHGVPHACPMPPPDVPPPPKYMRWDQKVFFT